MKPSDLELGQRLFIKTRYGIEVWKRIQAFEARNSDGENAGYERGTVEGDPYGATHAFFYRKNLFPLINPCP